MLLIYYSVAALVLFIGYILCENIFAKFSQTDYKTKDLRMEPMGYNDKYVNHGSVVTYKYNRSTPAINGSFNFKLDNIQDSLMTLVQGYKFANNEYRVFPIRFISKFCDGMQDKALGFKELIAKCGNVTECKFKKDTTYFYCNLVFDQSKLPPFVRSGIYKFEVTVSYFEEFVFGYNIFVEIYRPIYLPNNKTRHKYF